MDQIRQGIQLNKVKTGEMEDWGGLGLGGAGQVRIWWGAGLKLTEVSGFWVSVTGLGGRWGEVGWESRRGLERMGGEITRRGQEGVLLSQALNPLCCTLLAADARGPRELSLAASASELRRAGGSPDACDAEEKQSHPLLR